MSLPAITEWKVGDLPAVRRITWTTWLAAYGSFIPERDLRAYFDEHYSVEALTRWMGDPENRGFLAVTGHTPAGYVRTHADPQSERFYVSSLYVLPEAQGAGLGGLLMSVAEKRALGLGAEKVWLGVMEQNVRTLEWYRKQGFQFVEEAPFVMGETTVNHFIGYKLIHTEPS
jgi:ribosomal protein S18 acetylase RimI-like enzyme